MTWFRALSNIEHGEQVADDEGGGVRVFNFPHGSEVKGLSKEVMEVLWDAGVLERVEDSQRPEPTVTVRQAETPAAPGDVSDPTVDPNAAGDKTDGDDDATA